MQYGYDGIPLSGCATSPPSLSPVDANPISYRTAMCDGSGATAWAHDALGRVLTEQRIINGTSAINKNTKYTYYKDGELNKLNYPGSGLLITYTANSSSARRIDAQVWGESLSPGQSVDILYESANPSRIRLANNPAEVTLAGSMKAALLFLVPGLLLAFASRPR